MMRRVLVLTLAIMAVAAVAAFAQEDYQYTGQDPRGAILPPGAVNPGTFELVNGNWVPATYAMSWNSNPANSSGMTNLEVTSFDIINHVSVAQWVDWMISGTRKDWRILRPGTYASDSVTATIRSNNDVIIEFYATDPEYIAEDGVTRTIPKWFGVSEGQSANGPEEVVGWIRVNEYSADNPFRITLTDSADLHAGLAFKVWERIEVVASNSSSDYRGVGTVTIRLTNMKHWVDPDTGTFYEGGISPSDEAGDYV